MLPSFAVVCYTTIDNVKNANVIGDCLKDESNSDHSSKVNSMTQTAFACCSEKEIT